MESLSIVVPVWNEENNILPLVERIDAALKKNKIDYEIIFIDDFSTDKTKTIISQLKEKYPIHYFLKQGKRGKAYSLVEGFAKAKYSVFAMIDADLQYPPEVLPDFLKKIKNNTAIVVANRTHSHVSKTRKFISGTFKSLFGTFLFGLKHDVQAGLKVFTRSAYETVQFHPTAGWAFDLEFLHRANQAGFTIENYDIIFEKRQNGKSKISFFKASFEIGMNALQVKAKRITPQHIIPTGKDSMKGAGVGYKQNRYITHTTLHYSQSAIQTFVRKQVLGILFVLLFVLIGFFYHPIQTLQVVIGILSFIYFIDVLFNLFLILKSLHVPQEISFSIKELSQLTDKTLPVYSILCPLYKEAHVIPQFLDAISKLEYPKSKLDVLLLLEEDDVYSIAEVKKMDLPSYVRTVVVPHSLPKTKPKACNYGLSQAKGEYLVIYDAEDVPDPLQLKKAYLGFQKVGKNVLCLQAKLNYYNPNQNLLTRFFTAEYSLWFDVTLTGLQSINTSIPLGGTSNHFRIADITRLQGWDPFNVTEDADLGIRLFKEGYQTAIIDSTTMEEANSQYTNWIRQRSRWIKGYMQTYLVHTRENISFFRKKGLHALVFHLVIGGKIAFILINPLLWIMTISYFTLYAFVGPAIESLYPTYIFYMAAFSLAFGNFLFVYYYMVGCAKKGQWSLIKYVYLIPIYWVMISIAGAVALYQLVFKPHYWEKTVHGLHLSKKTEKNIAEIVIEAEEAPTGFPFPEKFRKNLASLILNKKRYVAGGWLVVATVAANFLNFLYNAYLGRVLSLEDFSLISLVSVFTYLSYIPLNAIATTVNYKSGFLEGKYEREHAYIFWKRICNISFYLGLVVGGLWLSGSPFLSKFFREEELGPFMLFSIMWIVGFIAAADRGFLSGRLRFGSLALVLFIDPVVKLISAYFLVQFHLHELVYLTIPIAAIGGYAVGWVLVRKEKPAEKVVLTRELKSFPKRFYIASCLSGLSALTFLSLDIVLAKHFLAPNDAGRYALISLVGKMVFFMGSLASQFILPLVSRNEGANKDSKQTLNWILFSTFLLTFLGFICFGLLGYITIPFLLGAKTLSIVPYLSLFCFAMLCFSISRVYATYYLAQKLYSFAIAGFFLTLFQVVLISLRHDSILMIVLSMVLTSLINLIVMVLMHFINGYIRIFENNAADFFELFTKERSKRTQDTSKLRILIFNWRDMKHKWAGGAEFYLHEIARRWAKDGNKVTIFCGNDGQHPRNDVIDGIQIVRRGGFYTVYMWAMLYYIFRFKGSFDVIVDSENGIPFFTPFYVRKPIFLLIHHIHQEVFREHLHFPFSLIAQFIEMKMMPNLYRKKTVVTVSESSKQEIMKLKFGSEEDIEIIHPGIEVESFSRSRKTDYPSFLYLGRLKPYKNVDVAIKAFCLVVKKYKDARLTIAGYGESFKSLKKLVSALHLEESIIFSGRVSEKEKMKLLSESWVVLQPSMIEGWGITVIEANACATPVIASNVNGLRDSIIHEKTGILVKVKDVFAFADAMLKCLDNPGYREKLSAEAYLWSRNFSWDKSANTFYKRIEEILQKRTVKQGNVHIVLAKNK